MLHEQQALDFYLRHHLEPSVDNMLTDPRYADLLSPHFNVISEELLSWINSPYETNDNYLDQRTFKTTSGISVRSKSEVIIATYLHLNKIPFRYECALELGGVTYYPDFTIRHPDTGQYFYWEHFGIMDNPEYSAKTFTKLARYNDYGIIPSVNLLTTYETLEHPLDVTIVEMLIKHYFL